MRKIVIWANKGGVGKTTSVINIASALAKIGKRVLVVDCDAQGHASKGLGVNASGDLTLADLLTDNSLTPKDVIFKTYIKDLHIIPADISLAAAENQISQLPAKEFTLRRRLNDLSDSYDVVVFDVPPTLSVMTLNVFAYATEVLCPINLGYFSLESINNFLDSVLFVNKNIGLPINHQIKISGIFINNFDVRTNIAKEIYNQAQDILGGKLLESKIPTNVKLNEAQSVGKSIFDYDQSCKGALAYMSLAKEFFNKEL